MGLALWAGECDEVDEASRRVWPGSRVRAVGFQKAGEADWAGERVMPRAVYKQQQVTQGREESCAAVDVSVCVCARHWWRDRGASGSVTRLSSTEKRKGNKMWAPWQPRCPTRLRLCRRDLVNVGTSTVQVAGAGWCGQGKVCRCLGEV